jgi:hypothetical protein
LLKLAKLIAPSGETAQEYYKIASDFLWQKPNWLTRLIKAIETDKLNTSVLLKVLKKVIKLCLV